MGSTGNGASLPIVPSGGANGSSATLPQAQQLVAADQDIACVPVPVGTLRRPFSSRPLNDESVATSDSEIQDLSSMRDEGCFFDNTSPSQEFDTYPPEMSACEQDEDDAMFCFPDRDDELSWTSSSGTSPTRTSSPTVMHPSNSYNSYLVPSSTPLGTALPTYGLGEKLMGHDGEIRVDGVQDLNDESAVSRAESGSRSLSMPAMAHAKVGIQAAPTASLARPGASTGYVHPHAASGKVKRKPRQQKAAAIAVWPSHPAELCRGINDTWNSFQRLHKGRSVTSAEWKAARSLLWSMAAEAAAHGHLQENSLSMAPGGQVIAVQGGLFI